MSLEKTTIAYHGAVIDVWLYQQQFNSNAYDVMVPALNRWIGTITNGFGMWESRYPDEDSIAHPNRDTAIRELLERNYVKASRILDIKKQEEDMQIGFWVHGERARDLEQVEEFLKGDAHDRSKVQWFNGSNFIPVVDNPNDPPFTHPATQAVHESFNR